MELHPSFHGSPRNLVNDVWNLPNFAAENRGPCLSALLHCDSQEKLWGFSLLDPLSAIPLLQMTFMDDPILAPLIQKRCSMKWLKTSSPVTSGNFFYYRYKIMCWYRDVPGTIFYRVLRRFFTGSGYRVFNKLEK